MTDNPESPKKRLLNTFFELLENNIKEVVITNKHKNNSRLKQNNLIYILSIKTNEIEFIKVKDHFKNKMKYIANSDTLLYRNHPVGLDEKKYFFTTLNSILKEIKQKKVWILKNK